MKNLEKELRKQFAQKMMNEKLNHLSIEDSYTLYKNGIVIPSSKSYVISIEEFNEWDFKGNEVDFYINECLNEYASLKIAFENELIEIGDDYDHFDEFTFGLFPAPTFMELIK